MAAVHAGAQDYLVKGRDDGRAIRRAVRYAMERQQLLAAERAARGTAEGAARARDEVLSVVSHDLRAPLGTITMCAHALRDPEPDSAALADTITEAAEWSLRIISDLLDVSAIEAGRLSIHAEPMTAGAILDAVGHLFALPAHQREIALTVELGPPAIWLDADVERVVQALGNLVGNAIKLTPRGGRVSIAAAAAGDWVRFSVTDTGPGIASEHLPRLFDRFWRDPGARPRRRRPWPGDRARDRGGTRWTHRGGEHPGCRRHLHAGAPGGPRRPESTFGSDHRSCAAAPVCRRRAGFAPRPVVRCPIAGPASPWQLW